MQYISFIGVGSKENGYFHTEYNINESIYKTRHVQEAIIRHYISETDSITFFVTKESEDKNGREFEALEEMLNEEYSNTSNKKIKFNYNHIDFKKPRSAWQIGKEFR